MGAKTWMLVLADSNARKALAAKPSLDHAATQKLGDTLFPGEKLEPIGESDLSRTCPPGNEVHMGCFQGVSIIAAKEFCTEYPSKLDPRFIAVGGNGVVTLHAMHSVVGWFAYAIWANGKLVRSLSLSPDSGVLEDIGERLPFEEPYWAGKHPVVDEGEDKDSYPFSFHPLELGEAALKDQFGYTIEGYINDLELAESTPLIRYKRSQSRWWKIW